MIAPPSGTGYLGGDAPNVVQINGQPHQCTVDLYCNSEWCGTQETLADGSWRFSYLDIASTFDIIARGAPLLDDIISSRRTPYAMAVIASGGPRIDVESWESSNIPASASIVSGTPGPYSFTVISGTTPSGIIFTDNSGTLSIAGVSDAPGTFKFRLKIQSSISADYCLIDIVLVIKSLTVALLHFDTDMSTASVRPNHWTAVTNAKATTSQYIFNGSSFAFDGVNSAINCDVSPSNNLTSDFTIEGWANVSDLSVNRCMFDTRITNGGGNALAVAIESNGKIYIYRNSNSTIYDGSVSVTTNTWFHWAVVRYQSTVMLYVNGILSLVIPGFNEIIDMSGYMMLGRSCDTTGFRFQGHLSEFRVSTKAVYLSAFTPPTRPFPADPELDHDYAYRLHHLRLTGTDNDTQIVNAGYGTLPPAWTSTTATISSTQSIFGGSSLRIPGTGGAFSPIDACYAMGTNDFTWECFFRYDSLATVNSIITNRTAAAGYTDQIVIGIDNTTKIYVYLNAYLFNVTSNIPVDTWTHIALSCKAGQGTIYVNGTKLGSSFSIPALGKSQMSVGSNLDKSESLTGYIDEVRITKGLARYNANFTPPTAPFTY